MVGIININNNKNGTIGRVCHGNVRKTSFLLYGASQRTLSRSPIPIHLRLNGRNLNTNGGPAINHGTTRRALSRIGHVLSSNAHVTFVATNVNNNANAKTTPIVTGTDGRLSVLAMNVIAVPFTFRNRSGVSRTLSNIRRVSGCISTLLIVGGRHLQRVCSSLGIFSTFTHTSSALGMTTGDVTRVVASRGHVGISFGSIHAIVGSNNITVVSANFNRNRKHIEGTVSSTLGSPLLGGGSVCGSGGILLGVSFSSSNSRSTDLAVSRVGRIRRFVTGFQRGFRVE